MRLERVLCKTTNSFVQNHQVFHRVRRVLYIIHECEDSSDCNNFRQCKKVAPPSRILLPSRRTVKRFGFGGIFWRWTEILLVGSSSMVSTNNLIFCLFKLLCGTRQRSPVCPLMFIMAMEPLAIAIRSPSSILGMKTGELKYAEAIYADDTIFFF